MRMFTQILVRTRVPPLSMLRDVRARARSRRSRTAGDAGAGSRKAGSRTCPSTRSRRWSPGCSRFSRCWRWRCRRWDSTAWCPTASRRGRTSSASAWRWGARARDVVRMVLSGTSWNVGAGLLAGRSVVSDLRQGRVQVGDRELARSIDPRRGDAPAARRRRDGVRCSCASRRVDRSHGGRAARVTVRKRIGRGARAAGADHRAALQSRGRRVVKAPGLRRFGSS